MLREYVTVSLNDQYIQSTVHIVVELYAIKLFNKILIFPIYYTLKFSEAITGTVKVIRLVPWNKKRNKTTQTNLHICLCFSYYALSCPQFM